MLPLILLAAAVATTGFQDTAALDRAVVGFTGHAAGELGGARAPVDARLRLASCPMVALSWRSDSHDAVTVACSGPDWRIFVPVRAEVQAGTVRTAIAAPIKAEPVIRRGDPVVIEAGSNGFAVTREGIAAGDAPPGARLAVRVDGAPLPVQAVAVATGRVTLPGWTE